MTLTDPATAPLLLTDADVAERVDDIVGPALVRRLWLLLVDGDRRQTPVVLPIADPPRRPDAATVEGLAAVLAEVRGDLATPAGPGSVVVVLERPGSAVPDRDDWAWTRALLDACGRSVTGVLGVFLSTSRGVQRLE